MSQERTYEDICTFCHEVFGRGESNLYYDLQLAESRDEYVLAETEHFVVIPCIGALTDWYVLVVSRRHVLSVGWLTEAEQQELRTLLTTLTNRLRERSRTDVMVFEHGSYDFRDKGGACYDHAHVHVMGTRQKPADFLPHVPEQLIMNHCNDWIASARQYVTERKLSYLALQCNDWQMIGHAANAPSQFFRRALAQWMGADDGEWDWLTFPQVERVKLMMQTLAHEFSTGDSQKL